MSKHKSEDYKISAAKYYLDNDVSLDDVCEIFDCPKLSLYRWVKRYKELEEIKRLIRKPVSCKMAKYIKYDGIREYDTYADKSLGYNTKKCEQFGILRKNYLILRDFYIDFLKIESSRSYFDDNNIVKRNSLWLKLYEYKANIRNHIIMINENNDLKNFFNNVKNIIERRGCTLFEDEMLCDMIKRGEFRFGCANLMLKHLEVSIAEYITIILILIFQKLKLYNQLDNSIFVDLYEYMN